MEVMEQFFTSKTGGREEERWTGEASTWEDGKVEKGGGVKGRRGEEGLGDQETGIYRSKSSR